MWYVYITFGVNILTKKIAYRVLYVNLTIEILLWAVWLRWASQQYYMNIKETAGGHFTDGNLWSYFNG
jgi:hypothetical protein